MSKDEMSTINAWEHTRGFVLPPRQMKSIGGASQQEEDERPLEKWHQVRLGCMGNQGAMSRSLHRPGIGYVGVVCNQCFIRHSCHAVQVAVNVLSLPLLPGQLFEIHV